MNGEELIEALQGVRLGIMGVIAAPSTAGYSHSAGWNVLVASQLHQITGEKLVFVRDEEDLSEVDAICFLHGPNHKEGVYNLMGGLGIPLMSRLQMIESFDGPLFSVGAFSFVDFFNKRIPNGEKWKSSDPIIIDPNPQNTSLTIGDSHSISVWTPGEAILRMDGKTLYGWLKNPTMFTGIDRLTSYFGNIDIRFHLARQPDPIKATEELACRYLEWLTSLDVNQVRVAELLPIEDESRALPGTGKLNGQNFYGDLKLRQDLRLVFNSVLQDFSEVVEVISWPTNYVDEDNKLKFEVMEARKSVHLRPDFYQWDFQKLFMEIFKWKSVKIPRFPNES